MAKSSARSCTYTACGRAHKGHGLCAGHLHQQNRGAPLTPLATRARSGSRRQCTFEGCGRPHKGRGLCVGHLNLVRVGQALRPLADKTRPAFGRTCTFATCNEPHSAQGLCVGHYTQQRNGRPLRPLRAPGPAACTFDGCGRKHQARGLCKAHLHQQGKGRPLRPLFTRTCADCGTNFPGRQARRCTECATCPTEIRRRHVRDARQGWTAQDYEDRRVYAALLRSDPCSYCGAAESGEVDHIAPLHRGGGDRWNNLTAACRSCNASKMQRSVLVYLLERRGDPRCPQPAAGSTAT